MLAIGFGLGRYSAPDSKTASQPAQPGAKLREPLDDLDAIGKTLPRGFEVSVLLDKLPIYGTVMALDPKGRIFLGGWDETKGRVYVLNRTADGKGDEGATLFADGLNPITGITIRGEEIWISSRGTVSLFKDSDGDGKSDSRTDVVKDLPIPTGPGMDVHGNNGIAFGTDGQMYFGMGASCNACEATDPRDATVLRCDPATGACSPFATGLRNTFEVAFHPVDHTLFGADNGLESIGGPRIDVPEELNEIREGADYGWPLCWGKEKGLNCQDTALPIAELPPHSAPAGLAFYTGDQFPAGYRNNLFVTLWGDTGRRIARFELTKGQDGYTARASDFVRMDRPVDIVQAPDGSFFVLDSAGNGRIYKISYAGA